METQDKNIQTPEAEGAQATETKVNKKAIITAAVVVVVIAVIGLVWFLIDHSASKKADEAVALADIEMTSDSLRLARYMDAAKLGHKSGNRAKLEAAIALYDKGEYEQAIKYLDDASIDSDIVEAGQYCLMGDCYVNLDNLDKALSCYAKAIDEADNNPQIVPFILVKEANIYRAQGKYAEEYKAYKTIYEKYPQYAQGVSADIKKYMERARIAAGK